MAETTNIDPNLASFKAASVAARSQPDCSGNLSLIRSVEGQDHTEQVESVKEYFFALSGSVLFYFPKREADQPTPEPSHEPLLGFMMVAGCEGYLRDPEDIEGSASEGLVFELLCPFDGWSVELTAPNTEDLLQWCAALSLVCAKVEQTTMRVKRPSIVTAPGRFHPTFSQSTAGASDVQRVSLQRFSSVHRLETAMPVIDKSAQAGEAFLSVQDKLEETRKRLDITSTGKKINQLDKMYDWEVNFRKLKLVETQGAGASQRSIVRRIQSKLSNMSIPTIRESIVAGVPSEKPSEDLTVEHMESGIPLFTPTIAEADAAEIEELVRDSPGFQDQLAEWDRDAALILENSKKMLKSAEAFLRANEEAVTAGQALASDIESFGMTLSPGGTAGEGYRLVLHEWRFMCQEILILRTVLDEQLQTLKQYFRHDVRTMRKAKQEYETARARYATAMQKYLSVAQGLNDQDKGLQQVEILTLKEKLASLGYNLYQEVMTFQLERHLVLLEHIFYFMSLHTSFFHHGYHTTKNHAVDVQLLRELIDKNRRDAKQRQTAVREMYTETRNRVNVGISESDMMTTLATEGSNVKKEGWLNKLSTSYTPGKQKWKRKWFVLENGKLCYRKDSRTAETKGNMNVMLTTVKLAPDTKGSRAFTFEVICANPQAHWVIQAEGDQDRKEWIHALQSVTANLLGVQAPGAPPHHSMRVSEAPSVGSPTSGDMGEGMSLLEVSPTCVECDSPAEWASINLGVTLCLECSGAHRSLGVHISKVRSLAMDSWPPSLLCFMKASGNELSRRVWEHELEHSPQRMTRPQGPGNVDLKKEWCVAKYQDKRWLNSELVGDDDLGSELLLAVRALDLEALLELLACGVPVNYQCEEEYHQTSLHALARVAAKPIEFSDSAEERKRMATVLAVAECLAQHGANLNLQDTHGRTAMHYAAESDQGSEFVAWLIGKKANADIADQLGRTAADLAMIRGNEMAAISALRPAPETLSMSALEPPSPMSGSVVSERRKSDYLMAVTENMNNATNANIAAAAPLPEPWQQFVDMGTGNAYYYNPQTSETTWEFPVAAAAQSALSQGDEENLDDEEAKRLTDL